MLRKHSGNLEVGEGAWWGGRGVKRFPQRSRETQGKARSTAVESKRVWDGESSVKYSA